MLSGAPSTAAWWQVSQAALLQDPTRRHEQRAEDQEPEVPRERAAQIVAHVVNAEQLMVHQTLGQVEESPSHQQATEVEAPARSEPALPPLGDGHDGGPDDEQPRRDVEEAVRHGVDLQARD